MMTEGPVRTDAANPIAQETSIKRKILLDSAPKLITECAQSHSEHELLNAAPTASVCFDSFLANLASSVPLGAVLLTTTSICIIRLWTLRLHAFRTVFVDVGGESITAAAAATDQLNLSLSKTGRIIAIIGRWLNRHTDRGETVLIRNVYDSFAHGVFSSQVKLAHTRELTNMDKKKHGRHSKSEDR